MKSANINETFYVSVKFNNILKHFNDFTGSFHENVQNLAI